MSYPGPLILPGASTYPATSDNPGAHEVSDALLLCGSLQAPVDLVRTVDLGRDTSARRLRVPGRTPDLVNYGTPGLRVGELVLLFDTRARAEAASDLYVAAATTKTIVTLYGLDHTGVGSFDHMPTGVVRIRNVTDSAATMWELSITVVQQ